MMTSTGPGKTKNPLEAALPLDAAGAAAKIRSNRLIRFYFNHLKKYRAIEWLASHAWHSAYILYRFAWIHRRSLQRPLIRLSALAGNRDVFQLTKAESVMTPPPSVFPAEGATCLVPPHLEYRFPEIAITPIPEALATGGTNLVMTSDAVICHDLYDFARDYTSEELNGRAYIWPDQNRIAWLMHTAPRQVLDRAACFTDACATNYAHWMTEVLPRINLFCSSTLSIDVPIVVNDGLHRNIMESLGLVAGHSRKIIAVPTSTAVKAGLLYVTSAAGYVPFERRTNRLKNHSHGLFSPSALISMRDRLMNRLGSTSCENARHIVIRRNSAIRNISNAREIEEMLVARGFTVIEPEHLSFAEQVEAFTNAETVVGATGAAFANLLFCKPQTRIIIMISDYRHMPYWYWQNMACAVGNKITYVLGKCMDRFPHIHSNFAVTPTDVLDAIKQA
jgi:capsular polysaccharide biosynthesis protein